MNQISYIASESAQPQGIAALGLDWQILLFQAITFLLVFLFLKKFVIGKIYDVIDARDKEVQSGLDAAAKAQKDLANTQKDIDILLNQARTDAENLVLSAKKESNTIIHNAEISAGKRAEKIVADAKTKLDSDIAKARAELKDETARMVSEVSGIIIGSKLTSSSDMDLIKKELEKRNA
ncbi:MAG: F0F1 ATP synthase subunit B [Patescibacteria group bacterium]|nr:F0F1 ATP synthase subunit B [Patescibacteria group bacterium]